MEYGVVISADVNDRDNRFGFIQTPDGDKVYFNEHGGRYTLVFSEEGLDFATDWHEGLKNEVRASSFPAVGDGVLFIRKSGPASDLHDVADQWCRMRSATRPQGALPANVQND